MDAYKEIQMYLPFLEYFIGHSLGNQEELTRIGKIVTILKKKDLNDISLKKIDDITEYIQNLYRECKDHNTILKFKKLFQPATIEISDSSDEEITFVPCKDDKIITPSNNSLKLQPDLQKEINLVELSSTDDEDNHENCKRKIIVNDSQKLNKDNSERVVINKTNINFVRKSTSRPSELVIHRNEQSACGEEISAEYHNLNSDDECEHVKIFERRDNKKARDEGKLEFSRRELITGDTNPITIDSDSDVIVHAKNISITPSGEDSKKSHNSDLLTSITTDRILEKSSTSTTSSNDEIKAKSSLTTNCSPKVEITVKERRKSMVLDDNLIIETPKRKYTISENQNSNCVSSTTTVNSETAVTPKSSVQKNSIRKTEMLKNNPQRDSISEKYNSSLVTTTTNFEKSVKKQSSNKDINQIYSSDSDISDTTIKFRKRRRFVRRIDSSDNDTNTNNSSISSTTQSSSEQNESVKKNYLLFEEICKLNDEQSSKIWKTVELFKKQKELSKTNDVSQQDKMLNSNGVIEQDQLLNINTKITRKRKKNEGEKLIDDIEHMLNGKEYLSVYGRRSCQINQFNKKQKLTHSDDENPSVEKKPYKLIQRRKSCYVQRYEIIGAKSGMNNNLCASYEDKKEEFKATPNDEDYDTDDFSAHLEEKKINKKQSLYNVPKLPIKEVVIRLERLTNEEILRFTKKPFNVANVKTELIVKPLKIIIHRQPSKKVSKNLSNSSHHFENHKIVNPYDKLDGEVFMAQLTKTTNELVQVQTENIVGSTQSEINKTYTSGSKDPFLQCQSETFVKEENVNSNIMLNDFIDTKQKKIMTTINHSKALNLNIDNEISEYYDKIDEKPALHELDQIFSLQDQNTSNNGNIVNDQTLLHKETVTSESMMTAIEENNNANIIPEGESLLQNTANDSNYLDLVEHPDDLHEKNTQTKISNESKAVGDFEISKITSTVNNMFDLRIDQKNSSEKFEINKIISKPHLLKPWLKVRQHSSTDGANILNNINYFNLYKCTRCCYSTNIYLEAIIHYNSHKCSLKVNGSKLSYSWLECPYCEKKSSSSEDLVNHITFQHGYCNYQCPKCYYRSYSAFSVAVHQTLSHDNVNQILLCRKYSEKNITEEYKEIMESRKKFVKPYSCHLCHKGNHFYISNCLKQHIKTNHKNALHCGCENESTFSCIFCHFDNNDTQEMINHIVNHHPNKRVIACARIWNSKYTDKVSDKVESTSLIFLSTSSKLNSIEIIFDVNSSDLKSIKIDNLLTERKKQLCNLASNAKDSIIELRTLKRSNILKIIEIKSTKELQIEFIKLAQLSVKKVKSNCEKNMIIKNNKYTCRYCNNLLNFKDFITHFEEHTNRQYFCYLCGKITLTQNVMNRHLSLHHNIECSYMKQMLKNNNTKVCYNAVIPSGIFCKSDDELIKHMVNILKINENNIKNILKINENNRNIIEPIKNICHNIPKYILVQKRYQCPEKNCKFLGRNENTIERHFQQIHRRYATYKCLFCPFNINKEIKDFKIIKDHLRMHSEIIFSCCKCNFVNHLRQTVSEHVRKEHKCEMNITKLTRTLTSKNTLNINYETCLEDGFITLNMSYCVICCEKIIKTYNIDKHLYDEHRCIVNYQCRHCKKLFITQDEIANHITGDHKKVIHIRCIFDININLNEKNNDKEIHNNKYIDKTKSTLTMIPLVNTPKNMLVTEYNLKRNYHKTNLNENNDTKIKFKNKHTCDSKQFLSNHNKECHEKTTTSISNNKQNKIISTPQSLKTSQCPTHLTAEIYVQSSTQSQTQLSTLEQSTGQFPEQSLGQVAPSVESSLALVHLTAQSPLKSSEGTSSLLQSAKQSSLLKKFLPTSTTFKPATEFSITSTVQSTTVQSTEQSSVEPIEQTLTSSVHEPQSPCQVRQSVIISSQSSSKPSNLSSAESLETIQQQVHLSVRSPTQPPLQSPVLASTQMIEPVLQNTTRTLRLVPIEKLVHQNLVTVNINDSSLVNGLKPVDVTLSEQNRDLSNQIITQQIPTMNLIQSKSNFIESYTNYINLDVNRIMLPEFNFKYVNDIIYICYYCNNEFYDMQTLLNHWRTIHTIEKENPFQYSIQEKVRCGYCKWTGTFTSSKQHYLQLHGPHLFNIRKNSSTHIIKCVECSLMTVNETSLNEHLIAYHPNLINQNELTTKLITEELLLSILKIGYRAIEYKCNSCSYSFLNEELCKDHISNIHNINLLNYTSKWQNRVYYGCNKCLEVFDAQKNTLIHIREKHTNPYLCVCCNQSINNYTDLIIHYRNVHNNWQEYRYNYHLIIKDYTTYTNDLYVLFPNGLVLSLSDLEYTSYGNKANIMKELLEIEATEFNSLTLPYI